MRKSAGLVLAVVVLVFSLAVRPTPRTSFSDNFNDRSLAGWWFDMTISVDGAFAATHDALTPNRSGLSGVVGGN